MDGLCYKLESELDYGCSCTFYTRLWRHNHLCSEAFLLSCTKCSSLISLFNSSFGFAVNIRLWWKTCYHLWLTKCFSAKCESRFRSSFNLRADLLHLVNCCLCSRSRAARAELTCSTQCECWSKISPQNIWRIYGELLMLALRFKNFFRFASARVCPSGWTLGVALQRREFCWQACMLWRISTVRTARPLWAGNMWVSLADSKSKFRGG